MSDIQIPQRQVPNVQFQPPDLTGISAIYNRPKPGEIAAQQLGQGIGGLLEQYYKQQQLKAQAFGEGGPYLMNALYGNGQQPAVAPSSGGMQQPPTAGMSGGISPGNYGPTPQTTAPTLQPQVGAQGAQPQPDTQPSNPIHHSVASGWPDYSGHVARIKQIQGQMQQASDLYGSSKYGLGQQKMFSDQLAAEKAAMEGEQLGATGPTEIDLKKQQLANEQQKIPLAIGQGSAEQQKGYNVQDQKIQAGFSALADYWKALQAVPSAQKGAGVGFLTSKAGSPAGAAAPALVAANKARTLAVSTLATALLPESERTNPEAIAEIAKDLPSVGDDPRVVSAGFADIYHKLATQHQLNTSGAQSAAQAFGGQIQPSKVPKMNFQPNGGMLTIRDSKGGMHLLPAQSLQAAKQRDPGLQVVSQ